MTVEVKADPAMPPNKHTAFAPSSGFAIGSAVHPPLCADRLPRRHHLRPEVLAPGGLCCPALHHLATSSANVEISVSLPGSAGYRHGP